MVFRMNPSKKRYLLFFCTFIILLITALFIGKAVSILNYKGIYTGVYIENLNMGNMSAEEARELLGQAYNDIIRGVELRLIYEGNTKVIKPGAIDLKPDVETAFQQAYIIGRIGNILDRTRDILDSNVNGRKISVSYHYNESKLRDILEEVNRSITVAPKNAFIILENNKPKIIPEEMGKALDIEKNLKLIKQSIQSEAFGNVNLVMTEYAPKILTGDLKSIEGEIGASTTVFGLNDTNRVENIKLAANRVNGVILMPGEVFSMNDILGPRTAQNGYKEAKVIFKNELVPGMGGGVCQVTTTLYRTVLLSRLRVVERVNHSLTLGYVEPGQDATLAEGYIDFKFENSTNGPIAIFANINKNVLEVKVYGRPDPEKVRVKLVSVITEEIFLNEYEMIPDNTLRENEKVVVREPQKGVKVTVYREIYKDNKLVEKELISEDKYQAVKGQMKMGTLKASNP